MNKVDVGETLQPLLGKCSVARAVELLRGAAIALDTVHSSGKAHLDLKASSVLVATEDKISLTDPADPRSRSIIDLWNQMDATEKTVAAFAPEEISDPSSPLRSGTDEDGLVLKADQKRDLWAFGVLAYELVYGKQPFVDEVDPEDREAFFSAISDNELTLPPLSATGEEVPLVLRSKIHRCLQKDPRLRGNARGSAVGISQKPEGAANKQSIPFSCASPLLKVKPPSFASTSTNSTASMTLGDIVANRSQNRSQNQLTPRARPPAVTMLDIAMPEHSTSDSSKSLKTNLDSSKSPTFLSPKKYSFLSFGSTSSREPLTRSSSNTNFIPGMGERRTSQQTTSESSDERRGSSAQQGNFNPSVLEVATPGGPEQLAEDIVVGPTGFEIRCTSCEGDIGPMAFRCETDTRYVICANCMAEERYDPSLKLIQYAVEHMDEERMHGAFGSSVFTKQTSCESTGSSGKIRRSSRVSGGVSPRTSVNESTGASSFGAKAETVSVLFTEGNDATPQQVSISGLRGANTIIENFDLEISETMLASTQGSSVSSKLGGSSNGVRRTSFWRPVEDERESGSPRNVSPSAPMTPGPQAGSPSPRSQVFVKVETLSQHESTLFGVTGKLPQTQLAITKKSFLEHMGARGAQQQPQAGLVEPERTATFHEDSTTRVSTPNSESENSELTSEEEDESPSPAKPGKLPNPRALGFAGPPEEDPEEIVDEFLTKADAYLGAIQKAGGSDGLIPVQLSLYTLNLERLPDRLETCGKLETLSVLDLSENRLEMLPDYVGSCAVNLKKLCLGNNKLKSLPKTLGGLSRLEVLEVNHNRLSDLPVSLAQAETLKTIGLDYNNFSSIPECVWCMPQLTTLFLAANPDILEWPAIENLSFVENLTLGIDNHPKLVRSYKEQSMEALLGESFEVAWNKVYPEEVLPGKLYLGSLKSAQLEHVYQRLEIGAVLTVARDLKPTIGKNMRHKTIVVDDIPGASFEDSFHDCFDFIDSCPQENNPERGPAVLVHCFAGMSRSSTCVIAYLMTKHKMRLDEAYTTTKEARSCIYPNDGFFGQLLQLDAKLYPKSEGHRCLELEGLGRGNIPGFEPKK